MRLGFSCDEAPIKVSLPKDSAEPAVFEIGFMPSGLLSELCVRMGEQHQGEGVVERFRRNRDFSEDLVRWCVRGHSDLIGADGRPVPFSTMPDRFDGLEYRAVSLPVMEVYRRAGLMGALADAAFAHQHLGEEAKKN